MLFDHIQYTLTARLREMVNMALKISHPGEGKEILELFNSNKEGRHALLRDHCEDLCTAIEEVGVLSWKGCVCY